MDTRRKKGVDALGASGIPYRMIKHGVARTVGEYGAAASARWRSRSRKSLRARCQGRRHFVPVAARDRIVDVTLRTLLGTSARFFASESGCLLGLEKGAVIRLG